MEQNSSQDLARTIEVMERKLIQLKTSYEQYFLGLERREPVILRAEVDRLFRQNATTIVQNTGLKFKLSGLVARYNSFRAHWDKQLRDLEEGHSKRDLFRAKINARDQQGSSDEPATKSTARSKKPAESSTGAKQLFDQYLSARQKTKESTKGITPERMQEIVQQQSAAIRQRYKCKRVVFKVVVEGGKAKIKALPKND
jgi:hypothetical protein